jgi:hypothetical protein
MPDRPSIPTEIQREILIEAGHRCAVCGAPFPLERAHIIPWHETKEHKAKDLICLCANCHQRADHEGWDEKTLRQYKQRPWVARQYENTDSMPKPVTKMELTINLELEDFNDTTQRLFQYALAAFLGIPPHHVRIASIERGSVKVTIELPTRSAEKLLGAYERNDPKLLKYLTPLILIDVRREAAKQERTQTKLTPEIIQTHLPMLNQKLLFEVLMASQGPVITIQLDGSSTSPKYSQLVADLNNSPANMAPRIIANYHDQGAVLPKKEERIIIRILNE